jgi:hypothetical protein
MAVYRHSNFKPNLIPALQGPVPLTPSFSLIYFIPSRIGMSQSLYSLEAIRVVWRPCPLLTQLLAETAEVVLTRRQCESVEAWPLLSPSLPIDSSGQPTDCILPAHPLFGAGPRRGRTPCVRCSLWGCTASTTRASASQPHQSTSPFLVHIGKV